MDKSKYILCSNYDKNENMQENVKVWEYSDLSDLINCKPSSHTLFMFHINIRSIQKTYWYIMWTDFLICIDRQMFILITETQIQDNIQMLGYKLNICKFTYQSWRSSSVLFLTKLTLKLQRIII